MMVSVNSPALAEFWLLAMFPRPMPVASAKSSALRPLRATCFHKMRSRHHSLFLGIGFPVFPFTVPCCGVVRLLQWAHLLAFFADVMVRCCASFPVKFPVSRELIARRLAAVFVWAGSGAFGKSRHRLPGVAAVGLIAVSSRKFGAAWLTSAASTTGKICHISSVEGCAAP